MKKKICFFIFISLMAFLLSSCGEILSVVTVDDNGKKVVSNYVSLFGNDVYDEKSSFNLWHELEFLKNKNSKNYIDLNDMTFKIENEKEQIVVLGYEEGAVEIRFFDGGYRYTLFASMENLSKENLSNVINSL